MARPVQPGLAVTGTAHSLFDEQAMQAILPTTQGDVQMNQQKIIAMAREGRPDLAAINAGLAGRPRLAAYVAKFPHLSGERLPARMLVADALRAARCASRGKDIWGNKASR